MYQRMTRILLGIFMCGLIVGGWAQTLGVAVFIDPVDGVRKVRVPNVQAVEGRGVTWAISESGRTVAYDSSRPTEVPPEADYKVFPFVRWGSIEQEKRPANPIDPYGFLYQEAKTNEGKVGVNRIAYSWEDYERVVEVSIAMLEAMFRNATTIAMDEDGFPVATVTIPGTTVVYTVTPFEASLRSVAESGSAPCALSSGTIITAANLTINSNTAQAQNANGGPIMSDAKSTAEWFFFYDQLAMWNEYVKTQILEEDIGGDDLLKMNPDEIRMALPDFYLGVLDLRDSLAEEEHEENLAFYRRMEKRKEDRERYLEWREEETDALMEFARTQRRQVAGSEVQVEGQYYLISPEPEPRVPEGRVNIVSESSQITPYDILTPDGDIVRPYHAEE